MADADLASKLHRIERCASDSEHDEVARNLLHAYIACLSAAELCGAALKTLDSPTKTRLAIRSRLLRLGREGVIPSEIDRLGEKLLATKPANGKGGLRIDALLSHLYPFLGPMTRQSLTERWRDRGTRAAAARWLKAVSGDDLLFSGDAVIDYWRQSGDWRAAKLIAYRAEPALVGEILPEFVQECGEGWIISRAALRAESVSEEVWTAIRAAFPATYAYLCAKLGRSLSEDEAFALISDADSGDRGLAIWAAGQLRLWTVLDRVRQQYGRSMGESDGDPSASALAHRLSTRQPKG